MKIYRLLSVLYYAGLFLVLAGTLMQLTDTHGAFPVFTAGVVPVAGIRLYNVIISAPQKRRINVILVVSALALTATSVAIYHHRSYWILFIAIAAVLDGYAGFRRES